MRAICYIFGFVVLVIAVVIGFLIAQIISGAIMAQSLVPRKDKNLPKTNGDCTITMH